MVKNWLRNIIWCLVGLALGIGGGLALGWEVWPTEFSDANPSILQENYRRDYILMVAAAYAVDGDLAQAETRLSRLGDGEYEELFSLMLSTILQGENEQDIRQLVQLADALGLQSPAMAPYLSNP